MEELKKGGIFPLKKPKGITCNDFIQKLKRDIGVRKIGYAGTLDKEASGVLVVGINHGTKELEKYLGCDKEYWVWGEFGTETDTLDASGEVVDEGETEVDLTLMLDILEKKFDGKRILQMPPKFSAKKIKGKRASDLVREGKDVKLKPCEVELYSCELLGLIDEISNKEFILKVHCSKGTYMRSLVRDFARECGTVGHMTDLLRVRQGEFELDDCIKI